MGLSNTASVAQSAAFALFEALRRAEGLPLDGAGTLSLSFARPVDAAAAGLAWTLAGDDALELAVNGERRLWVHACAGTSGPRLAAFLDRDRPALELRFAGARFEADGRGSYVLRERVSFPSHDGRHREREEVVRRLAADWGMPLDGTWLVIGRWNALDGTWDADAARRFAAAALVLDAARSA